MTKSGISTLVVVLIVFIILTVLWFLLRPESPAPESGGVGDSQEEPVALAINGNNMSPDEVSVIEGDEVNLQMTSDHPVELHLHGYDLEQEVEPGSRGNFRSKQPTRDASLSKTISPRPS